MSKAFTKFDSDLLHYRSIGRMRYDPLPTTIPTQIPGNGEPMNVGLTIDIGEGRPAVAYGLVDGRVFGMGFISTFEMSLAPLPPA